MAVVGAQNASYIPQDVLNYCRISIINLSGVEPGIFKANSASTLRRQVISSHGIGYDKIMFWLNQISTMAVGVLWWGLLNQFPPFR